MAVPSKNVLSGKNDLFEWYLNKKHKSYNARIFESSADCGYFFLGYAINCFGFAKINKYYSTSDIANSEWLIVLV